MSFSSVISLLSNLKKGKGLEGKLLFGTLTASVFYNYVNSTHKYLRKMGKLTKNSLALLFPQWGTLEPVLLGFLFLTILKVLASIVEDHK